MDYYLPLLYIGFLLFGLLFGSFLNVVIYRLPIMLERAWNRQARVQLGLDETKEDKQTFNLAYPPSHCPQCQNEIRPWSNIPLLSFLLQKGRCVQCGNPIPWRYPLVELLTGVLFVIAFWHFSWTLNVLAAVLFTLFLIPIIFIDARTQLLPDILTLPLLWLGLLFNISGLFVSLSDAVLGAVVGYVSLWSLYQLFKLLTGKEGMGFGDFKLLSALGAWFGVVSLPIIALLASVIGLVFAVILNIRKGQSMPFGPCLAIAGWIMLIFNTPMMRFVEWWVIGKA